MLLPLSVKVPLPDCVNVPVPLMTLLIVFASVRLNTSAALSVTVPGPSVPPAVMTPEAFDFAVENYFSILKRGIVGIYHHVSETHLHRYSAEFDFRYNHRSALGFTDMQRTEIAAAGIYGKRLTYRRTGERPNV